MARINTGWFTKIAVTVKTEKSYVISKCHLLITFNDNKLHNTIDYVKQDGTLLNLLITNTYLKVIGLHTKK